MKNKFRYLLVIFLLLFITGCTSEYNITIEDEKVKEELIVQDVDNFYIDKFDNLLAIPTENKYYNVVKTDNKVKFSYTYNFDNYKDSNIVKNCYEALQIYKENDYYVLQSGLTFNCNSIQISDFEKVDFTTLNVNIKINNYEVLESNADFINQNVYTWNINNNNYSNKPIIIKFKKIVSDNKESKKEKNNNKNLFDISKLFLILGIIIILVIILVINIFKLNQKRNKI